MIKVFSFLQISLSLFFRVGVSVRLMDILLTDFFSGAFQLFFIAFLSPLGQVTYVNTQLISENIDHARVTAVVMHSTEYTGSMHCKSVTVAASVLLAEIRVASRTTATIVIV